MKDFRVVQARALIPFTSILPIRDFQPPALIVLGSKMNLVSEITYNGIEVSEFLIASSSRIILRIPDAQIDHKLTNLRLLAPVQLAKQDALIKLRLNTPARSVDGIDRLVQTWILTFMSTPGSDIFNPSSGGGGRALIGKSNGGQDASAELALAVQRTRQQILSSQAKNLKIPPAERLLSASLTSVSYDQQTTTLSAIVDLQNILGASASVTMQ